MAEVLMCDFWDLVVRGIAASSLISFFDHSLWKKLAAVIQIFKQRPTWQETVRLPANSVWSSHLGKLSLAPVKPSDTCSPSPTPLYNLMRGPQPEPASEASPWYHPETMWDNTCLLFKPLHRGFICYAAIASYYKSLEISSIYSYSWTKI